MAWKALDAVRAWRQFCKATYVTHAGSRRSWGTHIAGSGYGDEETLVQPTAFPRFASSLLGFDVGLNLAPEQHGREGAPDFTPADPVTHPFVFEVKGTKEKTDLTGFDSQVTRYLRDGAPRIRQVVLTNLVGLKVFQLDGGALKETLRVDLRSLLSGPDDAVATSGEAIRFVRFLDQFSFQTLSPQEKLDRVRAAPVWSPFEVTSSEWVSARLDQVVTAFQRDISDQVDSGILGDPSVFAGQELEWIHSELHLLEWRLGGPAPDGNTRSVAEYQTAPEESLVGKALRQYEAHVAYYAATRLMLVRVWEDLNLLDATLHDGEFDVWMTRFNDVVSHVVDHSFVKARQRYRSLFDQLNTYTWYSPSDDTYAEVIYELSNTYFGAIEADVLGAVYERLLERIDRKLLGQYYTPRDVVRLIWDLISRRSVTESAWEEDRGPRVLDIATGSGGFLVDIAARLARSLADQVREGASVDRQSWINQVADGLVGVELQRFPAYLAELNLLIQLGRVLKDDPALRIPPLSILNTDTLSLHNPEELIEEAPKQVSGTLLADAAERREKASRVKNALTHNFQFDVACGNPPYIGEKQAAKVMQRTRQEFPYWRNFVGQHMDYLYWFLILGVSKLRLGGRFGFITTEYWLRSIGARPLRGYLAERCHIERIILFRDLRLFPDAPGQHSMVVVGERVVPPDGTDGTHRGRAPNHKPRVSIYTRKQVGGAERRSVLDAMRDGRRSSGVVSFNAPVSPNGLAESSWSEVVVTPAQYKQRRVLRAAAQPVGIDTDEGVLSSADRMRSGYEEHLAQGALNAIGWPDRRAGIFVLRPDEVTALGSLSETEQTALRPLINTRDVLPYAAVPRPDADRIIYIPTPDRRKDRRSAPFPDGMPAVRSHLRQFKPLLEAKVEGYGENRPWWSLHRPRPDIQARSAGDGRWGDYCLTARWGGGGKLLVGLPPAHTLPASGLHALMPRRVPAPYLCAVLNSTVIQDLAETLPPGNLTAGDIQELGIAYFPELAEYVAAACVQLADLVHRMAMTQVLRFPKLPDTLREDISLTVLPDEAWLPSSGPPTRWGTLGSVKWVDVMRYGSGSSAITEVTAVDQSLLGYEVAAKGPAGRCELTVKDAMVAESLSAYLRGAAASGVRLNDVPNLPAPTHAEKLFTSYRDDKAALLADSAEYRRGRKAIDDALGAAL